MHRNRIKVISLRIATIVSAVAAAVALTASPAHASTDNLSITMWWGWTSAVVTWPPSTFEAGYNITVNDSASDGLCVQARIRLHDYDGSTVWTFWRYDCSNNGSAESTAQPPLSFYPSHTVYSASLQLCRYRSSDGAELNCQPLTYAYR